MYVASNSRAHDDKHYTNVNLSTWKTPKQPVSVVV